MDKKVHPGLVERFENFFSWYIGDEGVCKIKGKGIPSLARTIFAETFEAEQALRNPYFRQTLTLWTSDAKEAAMVKKRKEDAELMGEDEDDLGMAGVEDFDIDYSIDLPLDSCASRYQPKEYFQNYEDHILKPEGINARIEMLKWQYDQVVLARRFSMNRAMWPRFGEMSKMFMFPRCPIPIPRVIFPAKRYKLWPSRSRESYHMKEILGWFEKRKLVSSM